MTLAGVWGHKGFQHIDEDRVAKIQREHTGGGQMTHGFHLHLMFSTHVGYDPI
jgi:hypothetical protein